MTETHGRWTLDATIVAPDPLPTSSTNSEALAISLTKNLYHKRLAHSGVGSIDRMMREDMVIGMKKLSGKISQCDACQLGKLSRPAHPSVPFGHGTTRPLELVVMDLAGEVTPCSQGGANYFLGIVDVFTRFS